MPRSKAATELAQARRGGPDDGGYPTALKASGGDHVLVGHVRVQHFAADNVTRVSLVACGDQLRTGAALNAVRIAQRLQQAPVS